MISFSFKRDSASAGKIQNGFSMMEKYCEEQGLIRIEKTHREIYITDARRTAPEKLKTVLRFKVSEMKI